MVDRSHVKTCFFSTIPRLTGVTPDENIDIIDNGETNRCTCTLCINHLTSLQLENWNKHKETQINLSKMQLCVLMVSPLKRSRRKTCYGLILYIIQQLISSYIVIFCAICGFPKNSCIFPNPCTGVFQKNTVSSGPLN